MNDNESVTCELTIAELEAASGGIAPPVAASIRPTPSRPAALKALAPMSP